MDELDTFLRAGFFLSAVKCDGAIPPRDVITDLCAVKVDRLH